MKKILLTSLFAMLLSTLPIMAENNIGEKGINLDGQCKAIASSPDGSTYVLMEDRRLICIAPNGQKKEITIPLIDNTEEQDDDFNDMAVDTKAIYLCGYNYPSIFTIDLSNPTELISLSLSYENEPVIPMVISRYEFGWTIKDSENRTFKVDNSGKMTLLPDSSEIILDKSGKAIINVLPYQEDEDIVYPGKLLFEDSTLKWAAPVPELPKVVMGIEYLGYDANQGREIYLVKNSSGDMDSEMNVYAVDADNKIVAQKQIPVQSIDFIMRYCKLANDGTVIAVYGDPEDPEKKVVLKQFNLNS